MTKTNLSLLAFLTANMFIYNSAYADPSIPSTLPEMTGQTGPITGMGTQIGQIQAAEAQRSAEQAAQVSGQAVQEAVKLAEAAAQATAQAIQAASQMASQVAKDQAALAQAQAQAQAAQQAAQAAAQAAQAATQNAQALAQAAASAQALADQAAQAFKASLDRLPSFDGPINAAYDYYNLKVDEVRAAQQKLSSDPTNATYKAEYAEAVKARDAALAKHDAAWTAKVDALNNCEAAYKEANDKKALADQANAKAQSAQADASGKNQLAQDAQGNANQASLSEAEKAEKLKADQAEKDKQDKKVKEAQEAQAKAEQDAKDKAEAERLANQNKLAVKVQPLVVFFYDKITRINNLTPNSAQAFSENTLDFEQYEKGFKVQKAITFTGGLGAQGIFYFQNATGLRQFLTFNLGLAPIKGSNSVFNYYVKDKADLEKGPSHIPFQADDLKTWNVGDSVTYESFGGAIFTAGAGATVVSVGTTLVTQGAWKFTIEKSQEDKVYVNAIRTQTNSSSAFVGASILSLSASAMNSIGNGFSYMIDLTDSDAAHAYEDMLKGNMSPIQERAEKNMNSVQKVEATQTRVSGKARSVSFGIPYLNVNVTKGNYFNLSTLEQLTTGQKLESEYGIYSKAVAGSLINRHKNKIQSFYSGTATVKGKDEKVLNVNNKVQFAWAFEKDYAKSRNLDQAITDFISETGLENLSVNAPAKEDLGYISVHFKIEGNADFTNALMGQNKEKTFTNLQDTMNADIETYFSNGNDKNSLCQPKEEISACKRRYAFESRLALAKIKKNAGQMGSVYGKDAKAFAQLYSQVGQQAWSNKFIFKAVINQLISCGSTFSYEVSGEKISNYKLGKRIPKNDKLCQ